MPRFCCEKCNFITDRESNYNKHLMTAKHKKPQKTPKNPALNAGQYSCGGFIFITDKVNNFNNHLPTATHKNPENATKCNKMPEMIIDKILQRLTYCYITEP